MLRTGCSSLADPASYRPTPGSIPDAPGVYRFRDDRGQVIYVGKAKSLRSRLSSYFHDVSGLNPRTATMVTTAASVDWVVVGTEVEALQLEYAWIKEYDPRFNVRYRDDKSYPYLAITVGEEFPRVTVMRGQRHRGHRYFGPYTHAWAIRETVDLLLRVFPMRSCSAGTFRQARASGRPCLLADIGKCAAPCVGRIGVEEHRAIALDFASFMAGTGRDVIAELTSQMQRASDDLDFERAARLRDDIAALGKALEKSAVVLDDATDADVVAIVDEPLQASVQVFHVRGGRIRGQRGFVVDKPEPGDAAHMMARFLEQFYGAGEAGGQEIPREILVSVAPEDASVVEEWLSERRGTRVEIRVPMRGDKRALMQTVERNAQEALTMHMVRRTSDLTSRSVALSDIQDALGLAEVPLRIECVDVSNLQGSEIVASLVVFEDGLARKSDYRRYVIRDMDQADDPRAIAQVVQRRFRHVIESPDASADLGEETEVGDGTPAAGRFAYPPSLLVVDGGPPQVAAAAAALDELGVTLPVCGLAKRLEEVWLPGQEEPIILSRTSEGLFLLQRIRDEAHRVAITHHRQRRSRAMLESALDEVPGVGPRRRTDLLRYFGSVTRLRAASVEQISEVPGIGPVMAAQIHAALHPAVPTSSGAD